ncbi:MAG: hypothetical protein Kow0042_01410 [Calditrichia bacterium]
MKLLLIFLLALTVPLLSQINVDGSFTEPEYIQLAEKLNTNQGFGADIDVSRILFYPDVSGNMLYLGIEGKLNTANSDGIGIWLNVTSRNGAIAGIPLAISGGGHFIGGNGGSNPNYMADFEVDYQFAFNTGATTTTVYFDAGSNVGTPSAQYIGLSDQSGTPASGPGTPGIFSINSITWAVDNSGNPLAGLELAIPFSELGLTTLDSLQIFTFVVSSTAYFSDVTVPGNIGSGNPGFDADFSGAILNSPPNSGPYHTDWNAVVLSLESSGILSEIPQSFQLDQNYPNPFNPVTHIGFRIAEFGFVKLTIYDLLGREVKKLVSESLPAGEYDVQWDGTDDAGQPVASGVYLYRLQSVSHTAVRKMLLLR